MITCFQVKSDRIHDVEVQTGTTVDDLKRALSEAGYDVEDALITVNRYAENDKLIGSVGPYVLKNGDTVEFKTKKVDLPEMESVIQQLTNSIVQPDVHESQCKGTCPNHGACASAAEYRVIPVSENVEIVQFANGFMIKVRE